MHRDSYKWVKRDSIYYEAFETIQLAARRRLSWDGGHVDALLSHMPYSGDHSLEDRCTQWRLRDEGDYLLHGHLHGDPPSGERQIDVGLDCWDYAPVSLETLTELVRNQEKERWGW